MTCHYTELTTYLPNRTVGAIGYKLHDLGIEHISEYEYLSEEKQEYLIKNWDKKNMVELATDLSVNYGTILRYKKVLNLDDKGQEIKWTDETLDKLREDAKFLSISVS